MKERSKKSLRYLTLAAVLTALAIVLTRFLSFTITIFRFGFGMMPVHYAGYLLGPVWGFLVGTVADLIGILINAGGTPHLGITLTTALQGLISGLVVRQFKNKLSFFSIIVSGLITSTLCSLLMMSFWLSQLLGTAFPALLGARLPNVAFQGLALIVVEILLLPAFASIKNYLPGDTEISWRKESSAAKYDKISNQAGTRK